VAGVAGAEALTQSRGGATVGEFAGELPEAIAGQAIGLAILALASVVVFYAFRKILLRGLERLAHTTSATWDDQLHHNGVFDRLAHLPPVLVVTYGIHFIPDLNPTISLLIQRVAFSVIIVVVARSIGAFLAAVNDIYTADPDVGRRSIKGYLQIAEIVSYLVAVILVVATLMDRSPIVFLSGLGAMTAVLLLVFRDTLLSLVASIQIATNDVVRVGDWVEMPQFGADGDVIDIALHTVKIQNWDKTISTVPTAKFIDGSFKNWRGMSLSGGRRIKRSIHLDVNSIRFLTDDEVERFGSYGLLRDYIALKKRELAEFNEHSDRDPAINADIRRLTNIGTLRAYMVAYLRAHPDVHQDMTLIVRQLSATESGVPIEIYCFSNKTAWSVYEDIQGDIFDHMFAVLPDFDLRVFQNVTDFRGSALHD
jgi:miniconductance mechanosensitive channel